MKLGKRMYLMLACTILVPLASSADELDSRVARVSYVSGDVSYQRGDDDGWAELRVNTPLVTGDSFYAPEGGRAEVDLGSGVIMRADGGTEVELVNNARDLTQLGLRDGVVDLSARSFPSGFTLELDTPAGAATILEPGRYRFEVSERGTALSVLQGSLSLALDGEQLDVREGESLVLEDTDPPTYGYGQLPPTTSFDAWADQRDRRWESSQSQRYVNDSVVGYEDLDEHGSWRESREYGRVWIPSGVPVSWAPYQSGRWIWQDPYGWTWVSYEPWGWAPYHYGRWAHIGADWCWVPPPPAGYHGPAVVMTIRPVYAPALVAFIGGSHWGVSVSAGGPAIGWVPLAPRETYYYPWQPAPRVTNVTYTNITINNAVTVVNVNNFGTGNARHFQVDRAEVERAPVLGSTPVGAVPTRESLIVTSVRRPQPAPAAPTRVGRPLVARLVPPPKPQPFAQKVAQIERTGKPVPQPIPAQTAVGKPFVRGAAAPTGVKPFVAPAPAERRELNPRAGAEPRPPKKIERDIAPPIPVAPPGRRERPPNPNVRRDAAPAQPQLPSPRVKPEAAPPQPDRTQPQTPAPPPAHANPEPLPPQPETAPPAGNSNKPPKKDKKNNKKDKNPQPSPPPSDN